MSAAPASARPCSSPAGALPSITFSCLPTGTLGLHEEQAETVAGLVQRHLF
ncbi:hypothetical protein J2T57_004003 [Natronocella acetinitrilica]|uniref:Uncharacterized protein n=1 Tax=Natronocella acetinitrilica TaxID=414046 RepID=A0AAE3G6T0_9GAMM|nr:hypothetical protein [Natronocella acetinitrilica]